MADEETTDEQTRNGWDDSFLKEAAKAALLGAALGAAVGAVTAASREALEEDEESQAEPVESEPRAEADEEPEAEADKREEPEAEAEPEEPAAGEHEEPEVEAESDEPEADEFEEPEAEADEEEPVADEEPREPEEHHPAPAGLDVVRRAQSQLAQLTGRQIEGVLGMEQTDGGWRVTVEVVEVARVPSSTDVLAAYEVLVSESGDVEGWHRTRRYIRSRPESEGVA